MKAVLMTAVGGPEVLAVVPQTAAIRRGRREAVGDDLGDVALVAIAVVVRAVLNMSLDVDLFPLGQVLAVLLFYRLTHIMKK